ncbi:MAG: hypothetical protein ACE5ES_01280 [Candidatus Nanoarchaeia archaeon]
MVFLISFVSAEILINQEPESLYNLGDIINLPVKIATLSEIKGAFTMDLICNGIETEVYKADVELSAGEEQNINPIIILEKNRIGQSTGICKIKSALGEEFTLTDEFTISNVISVEIKIEETEFSPGESVIIEGTAVKENGNNAEGFVELNIVSGPVNDTSNIQVLETVNNGYFGINLTFPKNMPAGSHNVNIIVYEKDLSDQITNNGFSSISLSIKQIPTNLELSFETQRVEPGTSVYIKPILHDQTGEGITSVAIVSIKDHENKILDQREIPTNEFLDFPIPYNQVPEEWTVVAVSNKLTAESTFKIIEKQAVVTELINKTLIVTNIGNVPYNNTIVVKIGEKSLDVSAFLGIDEIQKYTLTAPDGEYQVEILANGETQVSESVLLTGSAIDIKKASGSVITLVRHPWVWIFIIFILGFMIFMVARKGYKRSFIGYIHKKSKKAAEKVKEVPLTKHSLVKTENKADLSLSLKGDKQSASSVCLKIKNLKDIQSHKGASEETLQKIVSLAEESKAVVYEVNENIFFISAPAKTKTFKNEKTSLSLAMKIKKILNNHNNKFKQKIEFGISLNSGNIIAKKDPNSKTLKFMSLGTFITSSKKISSLSHEEILLSSEINDKLRAEVKTEKQKKNNTEYYIIKEVKTKSEDNLKFIGEFLHRMEKK